MGETMSAPKTSAIILALCAAEITAALETAMIYPALKTLLHDYGQPITVGWLVTIYMLISAGTAAIAGRLGDIYGRRKVLLMLLLCGLAGSLISATTTLLEMVIVGRALQGSAGAILPLCFGLLREHLPRDRLPLGVGFVTSAVSLGTGLGVAAGGFIIDRFNWHAIFVTSALFAAASIVLVLRHVPRSQPAPSTTAPDFVSGLLFVPAIAALLLAISNGKTWGWTSPTTLATLAACPVLFVLWVRQSLRHPNPLVDVRLLLFRPILVANICMALASLGLFQATHAFALLLQQPPATGIGLGLSASASGLAILPSNVAGFLTFLVTGALFVRLGGRAMMILAAMIALVGWIILAGFNHSIAAVVFGVIMTTVASSLTYAALPNTIMAHVPAERTSEATGMMSVMRATFQAVGAQLLAVALASQTVASPGSTAAPYPSAQAYALAFGIIVGSCVAMVIAAMCLPQPKSDNAGE